MVEVPVIPESAPFNLEQRLWLNGFLAGYFSRQSFSSQAAPAPSPTPRQIPLRILFGTQTGTAHTVAKRIAKEAAARGCAPQVTDAADHAKVDWMAERTLLLVTSTYGDGDIPDNAQPFWDWLHTDAAAALARLQFSVLALGDRSYEAFCGAGAKFDARLEALGAQRIYPRADCDVDYEGTAKAWTEGILIALLQTAAPPILVESAPAEVNRVRERSNGHVNGHLKPTNGPAAQSSKTDPFSARLTRNLLLTGPGSAKEVRHYELSLEGSGLAYQAGDALGVVPVNCPELVNDVLAVLRCTGEELVPLEGNEVSLGSALARSLDANKPAPELVRAVAQAAPASELATLLLPERGDDLKRWLWGRGVVDLLQMLPEPMPPAELVKLLRRLAPRLYSISSGPSAHPGGVHLTVSVVRYQCHGRQRKGVASTFLADRVGDADYVKVFVQASPGFKLPASCDTPIIMVGPGTGIAPFRAFLEERQASGAKGRHWLFFGEQKRQSDFLYQDELAAWVQSGHLTRLDLAFSRDQDEKIYVQQRMLERAADLWSWLQEGAHFYVCGDASRMAKDVDAALHQVSQNAGGLSLDDARAWVAKLKAEKRYQRDVY